jgi:hypothetical protein
MPNSLEMPLRGAGGEPVDLMRTIVSHGVAELNKLDLEGRTLQTTLAVPGGARTVRITARGKKLRVETVSGSVVPELTQTVAHMFRLDEDLSPFYVVIRKDAELDWCVSGPDVCCARRPCSKTSSRRSEQSYE